MAEKEASNVITSDTAHTFYAERLGLADEPIDVEFETVKKESDKTKGNKQSEPEAEEEANTEQTTEKRSEKLNKRFDKVTQRAKEAEARSVELENRLKEYEARAVPQQEPVRAIVEGKPQASQFNDPFEYAEALAEWSAENALKQRDAEEVQRKAMKAQDKVLNNWNEKIAKAKTSMPDFDKMVQSSTTVVSNEIRDSILESDVGPQLLYHLASNENFAQKLTEMPLVKALREIGKLEARFEQEDKPKAKVAKESVSRSTAPSPIRPLNGGKIGNDVLIDTNGEFQGSYAQWKAARMANKIS